MKYFSVICLIALFGCSENLSLDKKTQKLPKSISFNIQNLTDEEYPDNPDIGFRSLNYKFKYFSNGLITVKDNPFVVDFVFQGINNDSLVFSDIDVSEFIPTVPQKVKNDEYLSYLAVINQEWNRNQVKFNTQQFKSTDSNIVRVDIARNCLSAYLWEVILYCEEDGKTLPYAHGWFDFPKTVYVDFFEKKNKQSITPYLKGLETWVDPQSNLMDLKKLSTVEKELPVEFQDLSDEMYPLKKARLKKRKEILYPKTVNDMRHLQTDSSLFATFTSPGLYDTKDPRVTELGRFYHLQSVKAYKTSDPVIADSLLQLQFVFNHKTNGKVTQLIFGGIKTKDIPPLEPSLANNGWKTSMGIGNHSFYEDYETHIANKTLSNPYFGLLLDGENKWLDSHKIGIDGPILHFDKEDPSILHVWLLSFERHALVGHYVVKFK